MLQGFYKYIGVNTDITSPTIMMKQYKLDENKDMKVIRPMLIDASIIDSVVAERNKQESQNGKIP